MKSHAPSAPLQGETLPWVADLSGVSSMLKYSRRPLQRFEAARALSDRAVAFRVLGNEYVALFDLDGVEQVLVSQHASFEKDIFTQDLARVLGHSLLTTSGDEWRRRRKLIAPSLQRPEIAAYARVMTERAAAFVLACPPGAAFDAHSAMMQLTLDVLVRSLFGAQVPRAGEVEQLLHGVILDLRPFAAAWRIVLPEWFPVPSRRRLSGLRAQLDGILNELITERRASLPASSGPGGNLLQNNAEPAPSPGGRARQDLLGRLLEASDAEGALNEQAVRDEALTMFLAGHETTALALTFALYLLARHPDAEATLLAELEHVLAGRAPTLEDVPALRYTRAVLDEALRLYPPAWAMGRRPLEDVVVAGVRVPRGTQIVISPWVLQRDPRFFPAPAAFRPERWLSGAPPRRFAYLPFGAGPRVCIGQHFALTEAVLLLATFQQALHFELVEPAELELLPAATLRPLHPVLMKAAPRAR